MKNISNIVENAIKKHAISEDLPKIRDSLSSDLELKLLIPSNLSKSYKLAKNEFLKRYFNDLLTLSLGNVSLAAKKAGIHRRHVHRFINELNINMLEFKEDMIKPAEFLKENIYSILENLLSTNNNVNYQRIYSNITQVTTKIAKDIGNYSYDEALIIFEREFIMASLRENNFDIVKTSKEIGMGIRTLYRKIGKLGLRLQ